MPAIFVGHGNPMNALLRMEIPRPNAILSVSAH